MNKKIKQARSSIISTIYDVVMDALIDSECNTSQHLNNRRLAYYITNKLFDDDLGIREFCDSTNSALLFPTKKKVLKYTKTSDTVLLDEIVKDINVKQLLIKEIEKW